MSGDDGGSVESDGGVDAVDLAGLASGDRSPVTEDLRGDGQATPAIDGKQEFLLEAIRRRPILNVLRSGPASTSDLVESADQSRSTVHRATTALAEYDLVRKSDGTYELTSLGRIVAEKMADFGREAWTAVTLESFLNSADTNGVPIEHFTDATVTRATPRQPHTTIQRIIDLIESADSLRMFSTVLSPLYVNVGYREMTAGMEIEAIFDREAIDIMVSDFAQEARETVSTGNFDVHVHDGLPFELFVVDDRIGMAAHDENGVAKVFVECDAPAAVEWGVDTYEEHRTEAQPLLLSDLEAE